jgi:hypothetical protein
VSQQHERHILKIPPNGIGNFREEFLPITLDLKVGVFLT